MTPPAHSNPVPHSPRSVVHALRGLHPVWGLNAAVAILTAALLLGPVGGYAAIHDLGLPWWVLAAAVAVTERWPVHLEFRRSAHSFSLTDVPVTLALVFLGGTEGVAAIAAGSVVALWFRRLPPLKYVFNLAQFTFTTALGFLVVHLIAGSEPGFGPVVWVAALIALQLGGLVTIALIGVAMWLTEGSLGRDFVGQMFGLDAVVTATNTSLALILAVVLVEEPRAAPLFAIPLAIAFLGYRTYIAERQRHEKLEFLYEANRGLSRSREVAHALVGLLSRALEAYRSEHAEVILLSGEDDHPPLRTSLAPGDVRDRMVPVDPEDVAALRALVGGSGRPVVLTAPLQGRAGAYLRGRGIEHAMLAELRGEERTVGLIMLANRLGFARRFTGDDLALFDTLAANASAALQYDRLEQAVSDLRDLQDKLHHQAYHDPLTGLANRALFGQEVAASVQAGDAAVAVVFIDLDDFKQVNDTLGHEVGDRLLRAAANRLAGGVRSGDLVARLGGDEFAILCRSPADAEAAGVDVAKRVLRSFESPVAVGSHLLRVRLSIGISTSEHSGGRAEDLLRDADVAMYEAKASGKGRYAVCDPAMRDAVVRRHGLREELERAIAGDELRVVFQPIVELESLQVRSMEALVRWDHPQRGRLGPKDFIPLAEETGLIVPLGRTVLRHACRRAQAWTADGSRRDVQVNLSARELEDDGLIDAVRSVLAETGLDPARLVFEVTETVLMRDAERGATTLNALRDLGVRLALDDFGTGYSSLNYLRTLPVDVLKVAKEFVDGIAVRPEDAAFVRLVIELADTVGLTVIAEGIESPEQLEVLRRLGCTLGQGFIFAPPADDVRAVDPVAHVRTLT